MTAHHPDASRAFNEFEWLLDGAVPASAAARRVGYPNVRSLYRAYERVHRPIPRQLAIEVEFCKSTDRIPA